MQRAKSVFLLTVTLLAIGLALGAPTVAHAVGWAGPSNLLGIACLLLSASAAGGIVLILMLQRACDRLTAQVRQAAASSPPAPLQLPDTGFSFFERALGEVIDTSEKAVADAVFQTRELQIQLAVATGERRHAEAIIYSISDGVLVTDAFDELVLANDAAARALEFDLAGAFRKPVDQVLRDQTMVDLIRQMRQTDAVRRSRRVVEHTTRGTDGISHAYKVTLSGIAGGGDGAAGGVVAVLHDMTREKEVSQMKNDFVSMVSHELRTPLASIRAYVEMLIDGEARDARVQREFYEVIQNEANRLGRLIDDILSISRIESGLVRVTRQPVSLAVIVKDALEVIAPQAAQKQIALSEQLIPIFYQTAADRDMLHQAILNLLSNAVKYTPVGGSITAELQADETRKKLVLKIVDTGVGIPPKDVPYVFDKFFRVEANNRMAPGTGLGLSLVKHIIETVHGGKVFVESTVGKGSTFGVELDACD